MLGDLISDSAPTLIGLTIYSRWSSTDTAIVAFVVTLIALAGFIAMAETALTRISKVKAQALVDQRRRGAKVLARLLEHPTAFLNAILLTGLVAQLVAATLVGVVAERLFGGLGVTIATVFEVLVIFIIAEALPKNFAVRHAESAALFSAPFVTALVRFPLIRAATWVVGGLTNAILKGKPYRQLNQVSEEELLAMADAAADEDVIENEERELIASVIEFGDTVARELMLPRVDIVAADEACSIEEVLELALEKGFSRIPVFAENMDHVTGMVLAKDLMRASRRGNGSEPVASLARAVHFVPETKHVHDLLREMQAGNYHVVMVVDEYGGTAGLVSMEDLIEELLGDITDEFDFYEAEVIEVEHNHLLVKATKSVDELNEEYQLELPTGDWDTLGGLFLQLLGHLPVEGEGASSDNYRLVAEKVSGNRIGSIRLEVLEGSAYNSEDEQ